MAGDRFEPASAGSEATRVHPLAVRVMAERGIDISGHKSKVFVGLLRDRRDHLITVCDDASEQCPFVRSRSTEAAPLVSVGPFSRLGDRGGKARCLPARAR